MKPSFFTYLLFRCDESPEYMSMSYCHETPDDSIHFRAGIHGAYIEPGDPIPMFVRAPGYSMHHDAFTLAKQLAEAMKAQGFSVLMTDDLPLHHRRELQACLGADCHHLNSDYPGAGS